MIGDGPLTGPPMVAKHTGLLATGQRRRRALSQSSGVADAAHHEAAILLIGLVEIVT